MPRAGPHITIGAVASCLQKEAFETVGMVTRQRVLSSTRPLRSLLQRFKVLPKPGQSQGRPALQPLLPGGHLVTIPMPWPGRVQTGLRGKSIIVRVVIIDAVTGVKQTKKFPLNIPCSWDIFFFPPVPKTSGARSPPGEIPEESCEQSAGLLQSHI